MTRTEHDRLTDWVERLHRLTSNVLFCNCTEHERHTFTLEIAKMFAQKRVELENTVPLPHAPRRVRSVEETMILLRFMAFAYGNADPMTEELRTAMITALVTLTKGDHDKRHALTEIVFGKRSTKDLTAGEAQAIVEWCECYKAGDRWVVAAETAAEARAILAVRKMGLRGVATRPMPAFQ